MTGRATLREIREALAAARAGTPLAPTAPAVADELDELVRKLAASPRAGKSVQSSVGGNGPSSDTTALDQRVRTTSPD